MAGKSGGREVPIHDEAWRLANVAEDERKMRPLHNI